MDCGDAEKVWAASASSWSFCVGAPPVPIAMFTLNSIMATHCTVYEAGGFWVLNFSLRIILNFTGKNLTTNFSHESIIQTSGLKEVSCIFLLKMLRIITLCGLVAGKLFIFFLLHERRANNASIPHTSGCLFWSL